MRILIATNHSYMFYRFRKELVEALMQEHEAILSTPFVGHEDDLQAMGLRCIDTEIDRRSINPLKDMKLLKTYRKMLDEIQPDLVITYSIKPNIYMGSACKAKGIPYVTNVQGLGTAFEKPVLSSVVSVMYRSALRKAGTVFFENEENAQFFLHKNIISARQMKVLPGAGRALITSDIPGCHEAVEDGVSGYLCPAQDAEALMNFFREFANKTHSEQEQMGRCGRALIERKFDKRIVVAQTMNGLGLAEAARSKA